MVTLWIYKYGFLLPLYVLAKCWISVRTVISFGWHICTSVEPILGLHRHVIALVHDRSQVWSLKVRAGSWDRVSWVKNPKPCTETIVRHCCRMSERPRNAYLIVHLASCGLLRWLSRMRYIFLDDTIVVPSFII